MPPESTSNWPPSPNTTRLRRDGAGRPTEDARSKLGATADNAVAKVAEVKSMLQGDSIAQFNA
jgi:hypothetical protein